MKTPSSREAVILQILVDGEKFGREIRDCVEELTGREMPLGSLYTTLDRMVNAGFLASRLGDSDPNRGGNRRRFFKVTASGMHALDGWKSAILVPLARWGINAI